MHTNRTVLVGKDEGKKPLRARCRWEMRFFICLLNCGFENIYVRPCTNIM